MDMKMGNGAIGVEGCTVSFISMPVGPTLIQAMCPRKVLL